MRQAIFKMFVRMSTTLVVAALTLACANAAAAQTFDARLRLDGLERLAPKAEETVNIEIDGFLIKFAGSILSDKDADERAVKELVQGLKGIYVKSYEFKAEGQFADADVASVREQLRAPGWSRVLDIKSRGLDFGDAEVYVASAGGRVEGFALIVAEPKELTVVNIVGSLDLDKLKQLGDTLDLPHIHVKRNGPGAHRDDK